MTNFDFNVKINQINCTIEQNKNLKFNMEVNAEILPQGAPLQSKQYVACYYNKTMTDNCVNLREATNYLIQLFYQTNKRYSCTRTKLGKLLSILAFKYARKGEKLFDQTIYKYPPSCGTLINELNFIVPRDIYTRNIVDGNDPDNMTIINVSLSACANVPTQYKDIKTLSTPVREELEKVFNTFGTYPASELGKLLNPIVECILINGSCNEIDLSKVCGEAIEKIENNAIVEYIMQQ